jgi:hypothetical protein
MDSDADSLSGDLSQYTGVPQFWEINGSMEKVSGAWGNAPRSSRYLGVQAALQQRPILQIAHWLLALFRTVAHVPERLLPLPLVQTEEAAWAERLLSLAPSPAHLRRGVVRQSLSAAAKGINVGLQVWGSANIGGDTE